MSVTLLTAYYTTANSSVLTSAELLVTSVGTPTTFAGGSTVNNSTGWYEVGLGSASTTFFGSIQSPTGSGALLDVSSLQGNALLSGSYSASMQFSLSQAATAMSGSMVLRYYKYNTLTKTYTSIGTITNVSVNINSTSAVTVTWNATQFAAVSFDFDEYLYVDIWFNVVTNTMTAGGQFQIIIPNSSTQGIATEYFQTPGYDSVLSPHQLAFDSYNRSNQSGWGTAYDVLHSWTARDATATYSIVSNQGKILQNSTSVDEINTLFSPPSNTAYEIYGQCTTSNATSHPGIAVNFQSTGNMVKCEISPTATNVVRYISGSQTTLKADTGTKVTASNATYNFRFRWEVGGAYYFKCWIGTVAEPAAWNCNDVTDATYTNGAVGIYLAPRGSTSDTCLWNQFYVSYSDLNENTVINGLGIIDASTTTPTPALEDDLSTPTEVQAWVVNPAPTDSLTVDDSAVTFALADTFASESVTSTDAGTATVIQSQSDALVGGSALDNFSRVNQSGFGTASDGVETWTTRVGNSLYSISSDAGVIQNNEINTDEVATFYAPTASAAFEIYAEAKSSNATNHIGLSAQYQSSGNMIKAEITTTATQVVRYISGTQVTLGSDSTTKITASNVTYAMRFRWTPDGLYYFRIWVKSSAEPATWNVNGASDTTYNSGSVGTYVAARTTTTDTTTYAQIKVAVGFSEGILYAVKPAPIDTVAMTESTTITLSDTFAADSVSISDATTPTGEATIIDALIEDEAAQYALAESTPVETITTVEIAASTITESVTDSVTGTESSFYALTQADAATVAITEIDAVADYFSVEEVLSVGETTIDVIIDAPTAESVTLNESNAFILADKFPVESVSQTEIDLTAVTQTDITTIGATDDSVVHGQPGLIFPDQLTITESISFAGGRPLIDVGLIPSDLLDWDTNFTDHCHIIEDVVFSCSSTLLDARSVLYANTISDGPTAYYQLNEDTFGGIFQRDGSDQPNNAGLPTLYGATLQYTWAQIEPDENNLFFSTIDQDILPWQTQHKKVILRVYVASTPFYNTEHNNNTAGQATPQWVFDAGAANVAGFDGAIYPVYWDGVFLAKYTNFVQALANYYDTNSTIAAIIVSCGVNGTTALEASGDTPSNTLATWNPVGYTSAQWMSGLLDIIQLYQVAFQHTPLILSVNDAVIVPDSVYNIDQCISIAVAQGVWLMDENVFINEQHTNPNWQVVPLVSVPKVAIASKQTPDTLDGELTLMLNYQSDYAALWADDITSANAATLIKYVDVAATKGLNDSSTSNFKMSIYGGVYPTSHISTGDYLNGAQQFDGLTGYGYIGKLAQTTTSAWTLKCTVYPTILPMDEGIAFSVGNDASVGYGGYAIGISNGAAGGVGSKFCVHLPGIGWLDSGYSFPQVGAWYTLFVTWDSVTLRFYANGVQTPNTYGIAANAPSGAMTIGAQWDGLTRSAKRLFIGSIDECAIYNFALDASRILTLSDIEIGQNELLAGSGSQLAATEQLIVDDASSATTEIVLIAESLTLSETFAYSVASSNISGYVTLASDQFNRLVSSGFGTATDGNSWQVKAGSSTLSVDGNVGQVTGSTSTNLLFLGTPATLTDVACMVQVSASGQAFGVIAFGTDASNYYSLRYNTTLQLYKTVAGIDTALGSSAAFTVNASTWYHVHLKVSEGVLYGNIWVDGSAEPGSWLVSHADTSFTSGTSGLYIKGATNGAVFSVDNLFAIDNVLSDYLYLTENYSLTEILPPLIDSLSAPVDASTVTLENAQASDVLISGDLIAPINEAKGVDFLTFAISAQRWIVTLAPIEQLTEQEVLNTPVVIDIPADAAPPLSDLIMPFITPVPVDMLFPMETLAESYNALLVDTPTLIDATTFTQIRSLIDQDPTKRYIIRAFGGVIIIRKTTPLIASDKVRPTDNPQEISTLATADTVAHGPAYIFSETLTLAETLLVSLVQSIPADATATPTDSVTPTMIPSPIDIVTEQESIVFATGPVLPADVTTSVEDVTVAVVSVTTATDVTSEEYVTDGPTVLLDVLLVTGEDLSVTATFVPSDVTTATDVTVTSISVTPASDVTTATDIVTPLDQPMLLDAVTSSDTVTSIVTSLPLVDTPIETESLVTIDNVTNQLVTLGNTENVTYTVLPQESNTFAEVESNTELVATTLNDTVTNSEVTVTIVEQKATESVVIEEQAIAASDIFDSTDFTLETEALLDQEYLYNTDSTVFTDSLIAIETYLHFLSDQPIIAADAVIFTNIFLPVDNLMPDDAQNEFFALNLMDASLASIEVLSDLQATTFTGWLDILSNTEVAAYAVLDVPVEVLTLIEGVSYAASALYQDFSTPLGEVNSLLVAQASTDSNTQSEVTATSVTLPVTEQATQLEESNTKVVALESNTLSITESFVVTTATDVTEAMLQVDASTVTSNTNNVTILLLSESNTVTGNMVEVIVTSLDETVTPNVVTFDVTALTVTDVTTVTDSVTPLEVTPTNETMGVTTVTDVTEVMLLLDVTTTTAVTSESNTLPGNSAASYVTTLAPTNVTPAREIVLLVEIVTPNADIQSEQESLAIGYTLLDTVLLLVETLTTIQQSYIKTFGVINTGQADGIINTGQVTGTIATGLVDGVIQ